MSIAEQNPDSKLKGKYPICRAVVRVCGFVGVGCANAVIIQFGTLKLEITVRKHFKALH